MDPYFFHILPITNAFKYVQKKNIDGRIYLRQLLCLVKASETWKDWNHYDISSVI